MGLRFPALAPFDQRKTLLLLLLLSLLLKTALRHFKEDPLHVHSQEHPLRVLLAMTTSPGLGCDVWCCWLNGIYVLATPEIIAKWDPSTFTYYGFIVLPH